ncbi:MAG: hypothetical protein MUP21_05980 [Dehalococcoidia bacterium]|nr:hypothetical protein [Dehalococcoidia bacterium]
MRARIDFHEGITKILDLPDWVEFLGVIFTFREDTQSSVEVRYVKTDARGVRHYREIRLAKVLMFPPRVKAVLPWDRPKK